MPSGNATPIRPEDKAMEMDGEATTGDEARLLCENEMAVKKKD